MYKIIAKILANRIKPLLNNFISPFQAAFLSKRQISDNIIISQEIIHSFKKKKVKHAGMGIKIDMSKAFDRVDWDFLLSSMRAFGFDSRFCKLIFQCISTSSIVVLVNGSPWDFFKPTRGLRQGYPLSPYLFIICMEIFSRMLLSSEEEKTIHGVQITSKNSHISHLFFADDCLLFIRADLKKCSNILALIDNFSKASGQLINFGNSGVFFSKNVQPKHQRMICRLLKIKKIDPKDTYLGTPLFISRDKIQLFEKIVENIEQKIQGWIGKTLAQASKLVLNKAFLAKPKVLWVSQLNPRYFRKTSVFKAKVPTSSSWIWKCISKGLHLVEQNSIWEIGDGASVNIWDDKWVPQLERNLSSYKIDTNSNLTLVKDLLDPLTLKWNHTIIVGIFPDNIVRKICNIGIVIGKPDKLRWLITNSGIFSVKSMYNKLNGRTENLHNLGQPDYFWSHLWKLNVSQRIKNFGWKFLKDAISTNSKLARFMPNIHPSCPFGCKENETLEHLLFFCPFALAVWEIALSPRTSTQLGIEINRYLEFWRNDRGVLRRDIVKPVEPPKWIFPKKSQFKLNIDATWISSSLPAGFSIILRNDTGDFKQGRAGPISATSPEEAEALGLWHGARWALDNEWANFSVEGDCQKMFDYLNGKSSQIEWKNQLLMDEAKICFDKCKKKWVFLIFLDWQIRWLTL
ncbi:uncharacterized protein LOC113273354 [Papaver somniferum]|uniref:uncharacterized protein LOC113273354 n=1 Tax=Papaver somniferum TaxID=3469 RepID=UPI000E6FBE47|nr:uncharacterized protein LOC113273354 [Papaver somniferum]